MAVSDPSSPHVKHVSRSEYAPTVRTCASRPCPLHTFPHCSAFAFRRLRAIPLASNATAVLAFKMPVWQ
eukprot:6018274-Pleurochrysis_carterae.AAC.2